MTQIITYPYLTPDPKFLNITQQWRLHDSSGETRLEDVRKNWDTTTPLTAEIAVKVGLNNILHDCGLGNDAVLRLGVGWRSSGTMLRGSGRRIDLNSSNSKQAIPLRIEISRADVSHDLILSIVLLLVSPGTNFHQLSPQIPGSILWISENRLLLDDEFQYFPTVITDFNEKDWNVPTNSAWFLQWDPNDLQQTVFGDIQLYLNAEHPRVLSALANNQSPSDILQQFLIFDVARTLILGALSNDEFVNEPTQYPEGTIGAVIFNMLKTYFPEESISAIQQKSKNLSLFDAILQHHLAFLRG